MQNRIIIDGHSHWGLDIFHGKTQIDGYLEFAKKSGINIGLIMNVPSPCKSLDDVNSRYMYWKYENNKINFEGINNPFNELNYMLYELLMEKSSNDLKLIFVPTVHPVLDDEYELEKMLEITDPVALKIHGIGSGIGPDDIPEAFINIVKKYNLPLILHTDRDNGATADLSMQYIRNKNDSKKWAKFLIENEIIGTLNHGASLNPKTFDLVNSSDLIKVALGPDIVGCIDSNRLCVDCQHDYRRYLQFMRNHLDTNKIIYDADYNWNSLGNEDYSSVDRVEEIFSSSSEQEQIFSKNILNHYPKLVRKIGGLK